MITEFVKRFINPTEDLSAWIHEQCLLYGEISKLQYPCVGVVAKLKDELTGFELTRTICIYAPEGHHMHQPMSDKIWARWTDGVLRLSLHHDEDIEALYNELVETHNA